MTHSTVTIDLGNRSYPIHIGNGLLQQPTLLTEHIRGNQVMVVTNDRLNALYGESVTAALSDYTVSVVSLPDGEQYKNLDALNLIFDALLSTGFDRGCTLIALGGGVVGDMTGFAAASYQRGVDFLQIPTTLLAQVDSSVGGKTGVNHALGKNMIGAFYQPRCVIADTDTLNSLDDAELKAGLAEVIKYGFILDTDFFTWLEQNLEPLLARDPKALAYAIQRSCEIKADVVSNDETEQGQRALLNLGHTFGHAIESSSGYGTWLHGEAVAAGTAMAMDLSVRLNWLTDDERVRGVRLLQRTGLPVTPPEAMTSADFKAHMLRDKKTRDGRLHLILMKRIGHAIVTADFDHDAFEHTLAHFCKR